MTITILGWLITGGVTITVAGMNFIQSITMWKLNRKAKLSDDAKAEAEKRQEERDRAIQDLRKGQKVILNDRIKYLGQLYIRDGSVTYDNRNDLVGMHGVYHELGGNGNLDRLMKEVLDLPLKS